MPGLCLLPATDLGGGGWGAVRSSLGDPTEETNAIASETVPSLQNGGDTWESPFLLPASDRQLGRSKPDMEIKIQEMAFLNFLFLIKRHL